MIDKVIKTIKKYDMLPNGGKVVVALSGGSDSMALLYSLISIKKIFNISIEAAHVNHGIRGSDADRDEKFVSDICGNLGIKLHLLRADVPSAAKFGGMTLEQAGRKIRYEFFNSVCSEGKIATAHNLNDRIETFIFNFTRGTALRGLCSIPPLRDNIIRPLIDCSKSEIINYCAENSIQFVTDETNSDTVYARNRIRHNVIPELFLINSSFDNTAYRCINSLNEDEDYLNKQSLELYKASETSAGYRIDTLNNAHSSLKKRAIMIILGKETGFDIEMKLVDSICDALTRYAEKGQGMTVQLPGGKFARTRAGLLEFIKPDYNSDIHSVKLSPGFNIFGNYIIEVSVNEDLKNSSQNVSNTFSEFYGNFDIINGDMIARTRKPGDIIKIKSRGISKSLRKIQNETGMLPEIRDCIPVICDNDGVLCAYGCGIDERFSVTKNTENIIKISFSEI